MIRTRPIETPEVKKAENTTLAAREHFEITPTGILILGEPTLDESLDFASSLFSFIGMAPLCIADLYLHVHSRFGEAEAASLVPAIGRTKHTLHNWISIVRQFPMERRVVGLEMGHYDAVTGIKMRDGSPDVGTQDRFLMEASVQQMPIGTLRARAQEEIDRRKPKTIEVEDEAPKEDDDKPVFDSTGAGEGMAAEHDERRAARDDQSLSDANQLILDAATASEKALSHSNISFANLEALSAARFHALANRYSEVAAIIDAAHENAFKRQSTRRRNSSAPDASPSLHGGADKGGDETSSPSSPIHSDQAGNFALPVSRAVAGHGADESPALHSEGAGS